MTTHRNSYPEISIRLVELLKFVGAGHSLFFKSCVMLGHSRFNWWLLLLRYFGGVVSHLRYVTIRCFCRVLISDSPMVLGVVGWCDGSG